MDKYDQGEKNIFGFWVYLMTDLLMFGVLFAAYAVLRTNTFGGPGGRDLFNLPFALTETLILLTSSFTCGLSMLAAREHRMSGVVTWLGTTFILGITFLVLELKEFSHLVSDGNGPQHSAFLSSFFTLVGTHGLHITFGLLFITILLVQASRQGLTEAMVNRLARMSMFWHFLDVVWIFIFTIVYLSAFV